MEQHVDVRSAEIKKYICNTFIHEEDFLVAAKTHALDAGLPNIAVPENVGKLLSFFTRLQQPKRILEVGTLAGYSTLWLAKGAPEAEIITLERDPTHARIARNNFRRSPFCEKIQVFEGNAIDTLQSFIDSEIPPFDLIFLDADKEGYPHYLPLLIKLSRPGTLLLSDNLIAKGAAINAPSKKDQIACNTYLYNELLANHPMLDTILINTIVGEYGRIDALGVSIVCEKQNETATMISTKLNSF